MTWTAPPAPITLSPGDTLPAVSAVVQGFTAEPVVVSATFELWPRGGAEPILSDRPAGAVVAADDFGGFLIRLSYQWEEGETSDLLGRYNGRFRVTTDQGTLSAPADDRLWVRVTQ